MALEQGQELRLLPEKQIKKLLLALLLLSPCLCCVSQENSRQFFMEWGNASASSAAPRLGWERKTSGCLQFLHIPMDSAHFSEGSLPAGGQSCWFGQWKWNFARRGNSSSTEANSGRWKHSEIPPRSWAGEGTAQGNTQEWISGWITLETNSGSHSQGLCAGILIFGSPATSPQHCLDFLDTNLSPREKKKFRSLWLEKANFCRRINLFKNVWSKSKFCIKQPINIKTQWIF